MSRPAQASGWAGFFFVAQALIRGKSLKPNRLPSADAQQARFLVLRRGCPTPWAFSLQPNPAASAITRHAARAVDAFTSLLHCLFPAASSRPGLDCCQSPAGAQATGAYQDWHLAQEVMRVGAVTVGLPASAPR